jgi:beta-ureidopropionase
MKVHCALIQMGFGESVQANVQRGAERVLEAGHDGAQVICLPELATSIYFCFELNRDYMALAEPVTGTSCATIAAAAREANAYVVFPFYERGHDGQLYNSAAFIDRAGEVAGVYRKNLIPIMKFEGVEGLEKFYFRPGNLGYPVFRTDLGISVGITICYERHFPEGPRCLALAGADLIVVPTATPAGHEMWEVELRSMAIGNHLWVGGVNRVGRDEGGSSMDFFGHSLWCSPAGEVVAEAGDDGDTILHAEIDTAVSSRMREDWGFMRDRRPDLYAPIAEG